ENITSFKQFTNALPKANLTEWQNMGGQMILKNEVDALKEKIKSNKITSWEAVHQFYQKSAAKYHKDKLQHALGCLQHVFEIREINKTIFKSLLDQSVITKKWMVKNIETSRQKDYSNEFRKMVYDNENEMKEVLGSIDENSFIKLQKKQLKLYIIQVEQIKTKFKIN
ncbi:MAG: DUF4954 family protein, partial [Chitinophagaceae bacterium]|nr:DUF4954 family protein [Chitinophagaceae bacterium]